MNIVPIWKSTYYETTASSVEYRIMCEGGEIFRGRAVKSPSESKIRIPLNAICADYLNSIIPPEALESALASTSGVCEPMVSYLEYDVEVATSADTWDTAMQVAFVNDTSFEERYAANYSEPINGHSAAGQLLPYSVFSGATGTCCYQ